MTRDEQIAQRVLAGETLGEVAADVGLTRQRVSQIVKAHDPQFDGTARYHEQVKRRHEDAAASAEQARRAKRLTVAARTTQRSAYSDEHIIAALRALAAERGEAPTVAAWRESGAAPSMMRVASRFGSWNNALEAAGLTPRERKVHYRRFSDDDVLAAVTEFLFQPDPPPSDWGGFKAYDRWARERGKPSGSLVRLRFGSWSVAKARALQAGAQAESEAGS